MLCFLMKQIVTYSYTFFFLSFLLCGILKFGNYFSRGRYLCLPNQVCMTDERGQDIFNFFHFLYLVCVRSRKIITSMV